MTRLLRACRTARGEGRKRKGWQRNTARPLCDHGWGGNVSSLVAAMRLLDFTFSAFDPEGEICYCLRTTSLSCLVVASLGNAHQILDRNESSYGISPSYNSYGHTIFSHLPPSPADPTPSHKMFLLGYSSYTLVRFLFLYPTPWSKTWECGSWAYTLKLQSITEGSQSSNSSGSGGRSDQGVLAASGLLPLACSATLAQPRPICLGMVPPKVGWTLLYQLAIRKMSYRHAHRLI